MEGPFDGAKFATPATSAAMHGVPVEAPTSPTGLVPIDEGPYSGEVSEVTPAPAKTPFVQRGATPPAATQIETTPVTPFFISTGDPFATLSQAMKDGSSLVITLSSILVSATRGPAADFSSEESEDILEDPDDEPALGRRISESEEEEESVPPKAFMGMCFLPFPFFFTKFTLPLYLHVHFSCLQSLLKG